MKIIKSTLLITFCFLLISCGSTKIPTKTNSTPQVVKNTEVKFLINLNDRTDDTFKVKITAPDLTSDNNIFQFASTAPGTYQVMDIGRFVRSFIAMDEKGNLITTTRISTNQFEISEPEKVRTIIYDIAETFDNPVQENPIYIMCGTSIEDNHSLINGQAVFGYFKGMQSNKINLKIEYPSDWIAGTALKLNEDGSYTANSFDQLVDSPILLGNLTKASTNIEGTTVDIFTYSPRGMVQSKQVLATIEGMLRSASKFLNGLPVDRYTFLLHFETNNMNPKGAWEHSYSSGYTFNEKPWNEISKAFKDTAAHEFFHIVTPLNIHSEIIHEFNFIEPVPSRHLWLYEGTTEWASHMMLLRSGEKSLDDYLNTLRRKVFISTKYFDDELSLLDLSLKSYEKETHKQYANIYQRGALIAGMLDIKLLELSNGSKGLIDYINELAKVYGPDKPFEDATFFDEFVKFTFPEIEEFMNLYVKNGGALPLEEFYAKLGITFDAKEFLFEVNENATDQQVYLRKQWMKAL
ncbi:M61 family metallopeptidase [Urechidicola croceus]|uniref:Peptidase n=1 Tax=Urechidicola croceus TaxID=1850246 RepID=A0A1D8P5P3_9FLAO|nr:hypothetical protein [Urechidicola croceus]AOW19864.1 hypothetical protein LPB138_03815 [Urechidicola croceus]